MQQLASRATFVALVALVLAIPQSAVQGSIDTEPVKVTIRNSGPEYDLRAGDEVEKVLTNGPQEGVEQPPMSRGQDEPRGHLTIRRIFLFPMHPTLDQEERPKPVMLSSEPSDQSMRRFNWPMPGWDANPVRRPTALGEREEAQEQPMQPALMDPIKVMLAMLKHTMQAAAESDPTGHQPESPSRPKSELDKESSSPVADIFRSLVSGPSSKNDESKEEVVEIDGKKFLRKMVVNKHVGDNVFFVTRRLVLTPLNETLEAEGLPSSAGSGGKSTTSSPALSTDADEADTSSSEAPRTDEPSVSSSTTSTTTSTTEKPDSTKSPTTEPVKAAESESSAKPAEELTTTPSAAPSTAGALLDLVRQKAGNAQGSPSSS